MSSIIKTFIIQFKRHKRENRIQQLITEIKKQTSLKDKHQYRLAASFTTNEGLLCQPAYVNIKGFL